MTVPLRPTATVLTAIFLAALAGAGAVRAQTSPVLPGLWESQETYSVLLSGGGHERKCLTPAEVTEFIETPQTKHYRCTYASRRVEGGRATFREGSCYSRKGRLVLTHVAVDGRYAPDAFHLAFSFNFMLSSGLGLPGTAVIDAHRLSPDCPADLPPGK